jgi:hypothetical protein
MKRTIAKFETGKTYSTRSICDSECIFSYEIIRRTAKSVWIKTMTGIERKKIDVYDNSEMIFPEGKYSMAPILRAAN